MSENSNDHGWWHTLPGVITAVTGLLTAVSGLMLALHQAGIFEGKEPSVVQGQATLANGKGKSDSPEIHAATPVLTREPTVPEEKPAPLALNVERPAPAGPRRPAIAPQDLETFVQSYLGVVSIAVSRQRHLRILRGRGGLFRGQRSGFFLPARWAPGSEPAWRRGFPGCLTCPCRWQASLAAVRRQALCPRKSPPD